ncbi:putative RNA polymerase II subunit B1 CTD phosphatase rpap2 [Polyodon spathula]|uniref:putative RNA polymerase II subunit B1 CTD phosphatase rpap2 n=1 Tax=Polyodon spathula TaxID=7913 RepID=UPI001B7F267E|nr:putative RNA polymerase II subunit B1 CTD phosphatase rpap2 [Polyodon spathula]
MAEIQKRSSRAPKSGKRGGKPVKTVTIEEAAKRKEALKEAYRKKYEEQQRALQIVERLLEDNIAEEFLVDCAKFITPANYKDTVEERFILRMCGYPVCQNKLVNIPKQRYKISVKTNKVYDITERKCFCSNFCYKASKHFEAQIPETPVWIRESERPPDVKLLKQGQSGSSGEEVKIAEDPIAPSQIENPDIADTCLPSDSASSESDSSDPEQDFVSSIVTGGKAGAGEQELALHKRRERTPSARKPHTRQTQTKLEAGGRALKEVTESLSKCKINQPKDIAPRVPENNVSQPACKNSASNEDSKQGAETSANLSNVTLVGVSKRGAEGLKSLLVKFKPDHPNEADLAVVKNNLLKMLKKTLAEWKTEETLKFLYGSDYRPKSPQGAAVAASSVEEELDEDDVAEFLETVRNGDTGQCADKKRCQGSEKSLKPLPDYTTLKRETDLLSLKVREFYKGQYMQPEKETENNADGGSMEIPLPLVDSNAQHLIQKRIVVDKLNRSLKDILGPLRLALCDVSTDLNNLIRTFRFTSSNIIHKNPEWTLISVVLLSVLTAVSPLLQESLNSPTSIEFISTFMKTFNLKDEDLESLVLIMKSHGD